MKIVSAIKNLGPKLAGKIQHLPAGKFLHGIFLAAGVYFVGKKAVAAVKDEQKGG